MKILLDECLDRRIAKDIMEHEVTTVPKQGWAGVKNGQLLKLAEKNLMFLLPLIVTWLSNKTFKKSIYQLLYLLIMAQEPRIYSP